MKNGDQPRFRYICENLCAEIEARTIEQPDRAEDDVIHCPNCGRLMARVLDGVERPKR